MNNLERFWGSVKSEEVAQLATGVMGNITMRTVSPVYYQEAVLIFTSPESKKYQQMKENLVCCLAVGGCYMEAYPEFCGSTMLDENEELRKVYAQKFAGAFDEGVENSGCDADFILLKPKRIQGWSFEDDKPTSPFQFDF